MINLAIKPVIKSIEKSHFDIYVLLREVGYCSALPSDEVMIILEDKK